MSLKDAVEMLRHRVDNLPDFTEPPGYELVALWTACWGLHDMKWDGKSPDDVAVAVGKMKQHIAASAKRLEDPKRAADAVRNLADTYVSILTDFEAELKR